MTYNEWKDELKSNLLSVSDSERRRVLDYYAEAYADRRDAGFTEREIIEEFGAPYDAAQRILYEDDMHDYSSREENRSYNRETEKERRREEERERREEERRRREDERERRREEARIRHEDEKRRRNAERERRDYYDDPYYRSADESAKKNANDYTWLFVLLCIIFCVPLFGLIMAMVGVTIGFCVAPFSIMVEAAIAIGGGLGMIIGGETIIGLAQIGIGVIIFGVGIILLPIFIKLVKLMWTLFTKLFNWVKSLFSGREKLR